ncbi:hybrid sensor histidine kinase/response regulator [Anaeromyxobacter oryzae]|uniref:hybrid sensor histidine kinase/response regulator n=1 Tax=Anaeromyxobacter oryzae TaxID=2918170 RepID=UPI0020C000CA|nr:ATP-binding protein [Anaeromyxobacter oryzae]
MRILDVQTPASAEGSRRSLDALRAIVEATTSTGRAFFDALVVNLARALRVRHAFAGELLPGVTPVRARTLAVAWDGTLGDNFVYDLAGTPCENVLVSSSLAYYPRGAAHAFPYDAGLARLGIEAYMGAPLLAPDGAVLGILVVLHDAPLDESLDPQAVLRVFAARAATELSRIRSEERLRESDDMLRFALEAAGMATFDWDPAKEQARWSDGAAAVLGLAPGSFGGRLEDLVATVHPDDRELVISCAGDAISGRKNGIDVEYRVAAGGGPERWIHQRGRVTRRPDGSTRISGVIADVTERRKLEDGLLHAQKMEGLGRLAGGVAHDFNNLLTVIRSFTELAEGHLAGDAEALELVIPIREAAERATALTRQLLAFARRQVTRPRVLELDRLVGDLGRLLTRLLGEDVQLEVRLGAPDGRVRMDPGQLEQVLVNLAVNARDAMPGGGFLSVSTALVEVTAEEARGRLIAAGPHVAIRVRDSGAGMDGATLARAFEPFFTTKGPDRGTGLGLATCHGIVAQAGGAIWLESEPGRGTTAVILLPGHDGDPADEAARSPAQAPRGDATLLFVEDEDRVRALAQRALGALGYRVLAARDGAEAIAIAVGHPGRIDLLVTDMVLPHMDGREVARRVRAIRPEVRVLLASGYSELLPGGPLEDGTLFLQKPYTPAELGARIREALR